MKSPGKLVLVGLLAIGVSGCGTVCNLAGDDPQLYGGLAVDAAAVSKFHVNMEDKSGTGAGFVALVVLGVTGCELTLDGSRRHAHFPSRCHALPPRIRAGDGGQIDGHGSPRSTACSR